MKRLGKLGLAAAAFAVLLLFNAHPAAAQNPQDFTINSFVADYYLGRNAAQTSTLHTTEIITAQFPNFDQNHGILRALPETYLGHTVSLQIDSVTDENGNPIHYTTSGQSGNLVLRIGDPDVYVHGDMTYKITYDQKNVIAMFSDHQEFYWNINGDQWQQPFRVVTARLHVPPSLVNSLQARSACYVGAYGAKDSSRCTTTSQGDSGSIIFTSEAKNLGPGETMTTVNSFAAGTFKLGPEIAQAQRAKEIKYAGIAAAVIGPALLASAFLYTQWIRYGRDPKGRGVIIPEYQPYKGLNVLSSDYILLEKLNNKAISALVIELAIKKYVTIYEVIKKKRLAKDTTGYKLKLIKDPGDLSEPEQAVVKMFFKGAPVGAEIDLSELKSSLSGDVKSLKKSLGTLLTADGFFKTNPEAAAVKYYGIGGALGIGGFFLLTTGIFPLIAVSIALAGAAFLVFSRYMPSRSDKGVEVRDHMLGLRDYIKLAEADRLKFLQSPEGAEKIEEAGLDPADPKFRVKLFESLLPYAMVFNLEENWSKQFRDIYTSPPDWYTGNWNTFNTVYLASSINNFSNFNTVNFNPPHSSGSSGFGGGFSGGGGGGGGGGGW
jgi:hypothetical protein